MLSSACCSADTNYVKQHKDILKRKLNLFIDELLKCAFLKKNLRLSLTMTMFRNVLFEINMVYTLQ